MEPPPPETPAPAASVDVRGLVVSVRTGEPVPAARLWLDSGTDLLRLADVARSAEDGTFRIEARVGDLLWVAAAGYVPWSGVVSASEDSPLVAALEEGAGIQGVVVTEDDQPVKGARVSVRHVSNRFAWPLTEWVLPGTVDPGGGWAETDAEGRFRVGGLREGPVYQVDVQLAGHVVCRDYGNWRRILVQPSQEDVWIVMHPVAVVDVLFRMPEDCVLPYDVDTDWPPSVAAVVSGRRSEALRAGRLPVQEEVSADLRLTTWLARGPLWQDGARPSVFHRVHGPGVKEASLRLPVVFGETRSGVIAVEPEAGETSTVRFLARFHSGSPYTGALWLTSRKITQGKRGYAECLLDFREGVATKPVRLAPGEYDFLTAGAGRTGNWWRPAGPGTRQTLLAGGEQEVVLLLEGTEVEVEVLGPDGRPVRGYGLGYTRPNDDRDYVPDLDMPHVTEGSGEVDALPPRVWMKPGFCRMRAGLPGCGLGEAELDADGTGGRVVLRIRLDPERAFLPRAFAESELRR